MQCTDAPDPWEVGPNHWTFVPLRLGEHGECSLRVGVLGVGFRGRVELNGQGFSAQCCRVCSLRVGVGVLHLAGL